MSPVFCRICRGTVWEETTTSIVEVDTATLKLHPRNWKKVEFRCTQCGRKATIAEWKQLEAISNPSHEQPAQENEKVSRTTVANTKANQTRRVAVK